MRAFLSRVAFWRDHRWAPERMSAYLDGELLARQRQRMERHVGECSVCRRLLGGLRLVVDALQRLPTPEGGRDPVQLAGSVRARLGEPSAS
jgi:anti-sigma factor RsiW